MSGAIAFQEAIKIATAHAWHHKQPAETIALTEALNRRLAIDIVNPIGFPPFTSTAMDGYAVGSQTGPWHIAQEVVPGQAGRRVKPTEAARIFTGAMIPEGTFSILPQEFALVAGKTLSTSQKLNPDSYFRKQGEELAGGSVIGARGAQITPPLLGAIAACGLSSVKVLPLPSVQLFTTGGEFIEPGATSEPGKIFESNSFVVKSILQQETITPKMDHLPDHFATVVDRVRLAMNQADLIITMGGASVGDHDLMPATAMELEYTELFRGVKMRPGRPTSLYCCGKNYWLALAGNPMSGLAGTLLIALPLIGAAIEPRVVNLEEPSASGSDRDDFIPCTLIGSKVKLNQTVGSHSITGCLNSDGLVHLPPGDPKYEADFYQFPWRRPS